MKKLFISQPMNGKADEEILAERKVAIKAAESQVMVGLIQLVRMHSLQDGEETSLLLNSHLNLIYILDLLEGIHSDHTTQKVIPHHLKYG